MFDTNSAGAASLGTRPSKDLGQFAARPTAKPALTVANATKISNSIIVKAGTVTDSTLGSLEYAKWAGWSVVLNVFGMGPAGCTLQVPLSIKARGTTPSEGYEGFWSPLSLHTFE